MVSTVQSPSASVNVFAAMVTFVLSFVPHSSARCAQLPTTASANALWWTSSPLAACIIGTEAAKMTAAKRNMVCPLDRMLNESAHSIVHRSCHDSQGSED